MAKISKKHRRRAKSAYKHAGESGLANKPKRTWSFQIGDLVEWMSEIGIITKEDQQSGEFWVTGPGTNRWVRAVKLRKLQRGVQKEEN